MDVDENIINIIVQKEVNLSIFHHKTDKEMTKLVHNKIQFKNTMVDTLFDYSSKTNLVVVDLINMLGFHGHQSPYLLGWVSKDIEIKVTKYYKIKFYISVDYIDEVEVDVVPLVVCGIVFGSP